MTASFPPLSLAASLRLPLLKRHLEHIKPTSVVEVGCGMGAMGHRLARRFDYRAYEPDAESFAVAAATLAALGRGEVHNCPVPVNPDRQFDLLVALEVLEHIEHDRDALSAWARWVRPGGFVLLSVPANPARFGPSDRLVGHWRRYTKESLGSTMSDAGFDSLVIESWGMPIGYLLEGARNLMASRQRTQTDMSRRTSASGRLLQPPRWIGRGTELAMWPFGRVQRLFARTQLGIGLIARGRSPQ